MLNPKPLLSNSLKIKQPLQNSRFVSQLRLSLASNRACYSKPSNGLMTRSLPGAAPSPVNKNFLSNGSNGASMSTQAHSNETEFLIAGAGPAGASLACFLTSYGIFNGLVIASSRTNKCPLGLKRIMVSAAPGTANTPRAHITNMAAQGMCLNLSLDQ